MPLTVSWQYGAAQPITASFGITVANAKQLTARYARMHGLIQEGMTEPQVAEAVIRHVMLRVATEAAQQQQKEGVDAQLTTIRSAAQTENALDP